MRHFRDRNRKIHYDYPAIYDHVHTAYADYGLSPTRAFEFVTITRGLQYSSALDVGCGNGQLLKWIRHVKPEVKLHGVDISQVALDKITLCNIALKQGEAQDLPYPDDQFDLVICTDVLEHLPEDDARKAIGELKRVGINHVWIQTDESFCVEDQYLAGTQWEDLTLHETRRTIYWWETNIQNQQLTIRHKQRFESKMSFLCSVKSTWNHRAPSEPKK
ncbi:MAG: class I SAM-dependent methyltransferase [Promethearchaeota archaeon]